MPEQVERAKYKNPPIEEAFVEFRFKPGREWDPTIPGKLHASPTINAQYPGKPRTQKLFQAALRAAPGQAPGFAVQEGASRIQLVSDDNRRVLSIGPDLLSVHMLRPYEGWEIFRPRIDAALKAYAEVTEVSEIVRIGVRYINKIVIPQKSFDLGVYFRCGPVSIIPGLPHAIDQFLSRSVYAYSDGAKVLLTHANVEGTTDSSAFLLDVDTFMDFPSPLPFEMEKVMDSVDDLHEREGQAFEAVITDQARSVFNAT